MKTIHKALMTTALLMPLCVVSFASAEEFQSAQDVSFTFSSTVGVTVSSNNLTIGSLAPGSYSDSNIITVTATSNAIGGYQLNSTVGNTTYNYTDLRITSSDTSHIFSNLGSSSASSLANLGDSKWGYSYSTDSGSTWRSGNIASSSPNPYGGYTSTSATVTHINTNAPGSSSIQYKIGAKASSTQAAGTYQNVVNFAITAKPDPLIAMQNFTAQNCSTMSIGHTTRLVDSRDGEEYLIGKLADGRCWMLDNLRLDITDSTILNSLATSNTHVDSTSLTSLKSGNRSAGNQYANGPFTAWQPSVVDVSYSKAQASAIVKDTINPNSSKNYGNGSHKYGVYYNYCAASAGSYCFGSGTDAGSPSGNAPYDLCPTNWRLPTGTPGTGEFQILLTALNDNKTASDPGSIQYNLSTPLSGYYSESGNAGVGTYGYFWSSTLKDSNSMRFLRVESSDALPDGAWYRTMGRSVRCILSS